MTVDINRPDEDTMWKLLKENPGNAVGAILRLSWLQGMTREEICSLTWGDIYTEKKITIMSFVRLKSMAGPMPYAFPACRWIRSKERIRSEASPKCKITVPVERKR